MFGDINCPSISEQERKAFLNTARLAALHDSQEENEVDEEELTEMAGYGKYNTLEEENSSQVVSKLSQLNP